MRSIGGDGLFPQADPDLHAAKQADSYARRIEDFYIDIDQLDPVACPPDRRIILADKEAWVYEHGNISELVFVLNTDSGTDWEEPL